MIPAGRTQPASDRVRSARAAYCFASEYPTPGTALIPPGPSPNIASFDRMCEMCVFRRLESPPS